MAQFPKREVDIARLAQTMRSGYAANPTVFPHADLPTLRTLHEAYKDARFGQVCVLGAAMIATRDKDAALETLVELMRVQLAQSEVDVAAQPDALRLIGWGPETPGQPTKAPGQPRTLEVESQGGGILVLDWKAPVTGGLVRTYVVERREQPTGGGAFGPWRQAGASLSTRSHLHSQPQRQQLEYRVYAYNPAGQSPPSNTVTCVM